MAVSVRFVAMTADRFEAWAVESRAGFTEQQVASGAMPRQEARDYAVSEIRKLLPSGLETPDQYLWCAYVGDVEVGVLWLGLLRQEAGVDAFVYDVAVSASQRRRGYGRAIMASGEQEARRLGASTIRLNVFGHNHAAHQMYEGLGYVVTTTNMARRLDAGAPRPASHPVVHLEPMTEPDFATYLEHAQADYAANIVASGLLPAVGARQKSADDFAKLLPDGLDTPGQFLWTAFAGPEETREVDPDGNENGDRTEVAMIWLGIELRSNGWHAFGFDFSVKQSLQRRGYGRAVMAAAEQICRDRDVVSIGLNVFGSNPGARMLYEQEGFEVTATLMRKDL